MVVATSFPVWDFGSCDRMLIGDDLLKAGLAGTDEVIGVSLQVGVVVAFRTVGGVGVKRLEGVVMKLKQSSLLGVPFMFSN